MQRDPTTLNPARARMRAHYWRHRERILAKERAQRDAARPKPVDLPGEEWRPVVGFEEHYAVSNLGRVRRTKLCKGAVPGAVIKSFAPGNDYRRIILHRGGVAYRRSVHLLVAAAFLGEAHGLTVNHIDGDKTNAALSNLEYVTMRENIRHAWRTGLNHALRGSSNGKALLTESAVREIRASASSYTELMQRFGVSRSTISAIRRRRIWKHLV